MRSTPPAEQTSAPEQDFEGVADKGYFHAADTFSTAQVLRTE